MSIMESAARRLLLLVDNSNKLILLLLMLVIWISAPSYTLISSSSYHELYSNRVESSWALELSKALDNGIGDLQMQFGIYPKAKVPIYIIHEERNYQQLSKSNAEIVEFSDAFYSSSQRAIFIRSKDQVLQNYLKILIHEYIHWYLEELFVGAPLWFHEGMATYFSNQLGYERFLMYLRESLINPQSDLFRMGYRYPDNRADWPRFYLSSAMAVRFMKENHHQEWQEFWNLLAYRYRQSHKPHFADIFVNSYHTSLWDFHKRFESHSKKLGYIYLFVVFNSLIFALLPFVMFAVVRKRRKRMRDLPDLPLPDEPQDNLDESDRT